MIHAPGSIDSKVNSAEDIKRQLRHFEKNILSMVKNWKIGYHWVKNLCEMLLHDRRVLDKYKLADIVAKCEIKQKVVIENLEAIGWVYKIAKNMYLCNGNFYGRIST